MPGIGKNKVEIVTGSSWNLRTRRDLTVIECSLFFIPIRTLKLREGK